MKNHSSILLFLILLFCQLHAADFPEITGWKPINEVNTYNPENLYEYIDGAAEQFISYGFQLLHSRDLSRGEVTVTVDIYDMGSPLNAFGIYRTERPTDREPLAIGAEATLYAPYQCLLLKDRYYGKVNLIEGEISDSLGKSILESIAAALPGTSTLPEELPLLPSKNKINGSEGFTREGFLGLSELTNCLHAKYRQNEAEFQYFVIIPAEENTSQSIWDKLSQKWQNASHEKHMILYKKIPYKGFTGVIQRAEKISGVTDGASESEIVKLLEVLME